MGDRSRQAVIAQVRALAAQRGARSAVVTFDRHPATIVRPESAPQLLTDHTQRLELLEATGLAFEQLSAVTSGMKDLREVVASAKGASATPSLPAVALRWEGLSEEECRVGFMIGVSGPEFGP